MLRLTGCGERKHKTAVKYCKLCDILVDLYYERIRLIKDLEKINDEGILHNTIKLLKDLDKYEIYK